MHKKFLTYLLLSCLPFMTSCQSAEAQARSIYANGSMSNREKIDALFQLYKDSYVHADNSTASDRAWDEFVKGNYDDVLAIIGSYGSDSYNYYTVYYAKLLQEDMPIPKVYVNVSRWGYCYDIQLDATPKTNIYYQVFISVYDDDKRVDLELIDTGDLLSLDLNFNRSFPEDHDNLKFKMIVNPYCGFVFDYYKATNEFLFEMELTDIHNLEYRDYQLNYVGPTHYFYD